MVAWLMSSSMGRARAGVVVCHLTTSPNSQPPSIAVCASRLRARLACASCVHGRLANEQQPLYDGSANTDAADIAAERICSRCWRPCHSHTFERFARMNRRIVWRRRSVSADCAGRPRLLPLVSGFSRTWLIGERSFSEFADSVAQPYYGADHTTRGD